MRSALTFTLAIILTALPVIATGLPGGLVQDVVDVSMAQAVEDRVQQAVERSASDAIDESVEQATQGSIEESVSEAVGQSVERSVVDTVAGSVDASVSETVSETVGETVGKTVADTVENSLGATAEDAIGQTVSEAAGQSMAQGIQDTVKTAVDDSLTTGLEQGVNQTVNGNLGETLQEVAGDNVRVRRAAVGASLPGSVAAGLSAGLSSSLSTNLSSSLPSAVSVLGKSGETLFLDVEVENSWRAVQRQWLLMIDNDDFPLLDKPGIQVLERTRFDQLGMSLVRFRVEADLDSRGVLHKLLPQGKDWQLERNHIYNYRPQSGDSSSRGNPARSAPVCKDSVAIGMVDTAVNSGQGFFSGVGITQRNFLDDRITAPQHHGTTVAGILVGRGKGLQPMVPNASLSVASVMYQRDDGSQGATIMSLLAALDWLASQQVKVVNLSLAGPPNPLLEKAVVALHKKNMVVVAAVGNEGPAAPVLYPAAYPTVIGVTAVDSNRQIYRWANRGEQVDFAAIGVAVKTVGPEGDVVIESGTSMATPVVSAFAACLYAGTKQPGLLERLAARTIDLGEAGRDPTFGLGFLK